MGTPRSVITKSVIMCGARAGSSRDATQPGKQRLGVAELVELFQIGAAGWLAGFVFIDCRWRRDQIGRLGGSLNRSSSGLDGLGLKSLGDLEVGNAGQEDALQLVK